MLPSCIAKIDSRSYLFFLTKYYSFLEKNLNNVSIPDDESFEDLGWSIAEKSIKEIGEFSKKKNIKVLLVGFPSAKEISKGQSSERIYNLSRITTAAEISYLDLYDYLVKAKNKKELFINGNDNHFTPKGSEFVANYLYNYIKKKWL